MKMRPVKQTPAHHTDKFAELVCSNSLRANNLTNAVGVIKEEMRRLDSLIISSADACAVPAGGALEVDRHEFAGNITERIRNHPLIEVINEEVTDLEGMMEGIMVIATGPLTSLALAERIRELTGEEYLYFYDAAAPIVEKDSIDMDKVYLKSRYDKGEAAYLNCPLNDQEFKRFHEALINAEVAPLKDFEKELYFEACMPVEVMARRGEKTLLFGPMKPVGLEGPENGQAAKSSCATAPGRRCWYVIQYRRIPDTYEVGSSERSASTHPWSRKCRNRQVRGHAPEYIHQFSACLEIDIPT